MTYDHLVSTTTAADPAPKLPLERLRIEGDTWRTLKAVPMSFRLALQVLSRLEIGRLTIVLPDGRALETGGRQPGPDAVLIVRDYRFATRALKGGNCGFAESYIDGDWDSPDPSTLIEVLALNTLHLQGVMQSKGFYRLFQRVVHLVNRNTKAGSRRNIHAHYDLGNEFYSLWLDPTMTYSSARFDGASQDLSSAQLNKYRALAKSMNLSDNHSVLEIGCGWGGFAEFAASEVGCKVTGITISKEQLDFAKERIFKKGLNEKVELRFQDYRDVSDKFDRVASIEMFEAVGEEYWPTFFHKLRDSLTEGGRAGLQIITIRDEMFEQYRRGTDFIQRYIFPGGMLPSPEVLRDQITKAGLLWSGNVAFGRDYAQTLGSWRDRFISVWPQIEKLGFDQRFQRLWKCYLSYCEGGFRAGSIDVMQVSLARQ
jgi:cyclopropane-fatty-acyl-phospholipid synthase